MTAIVPQFDALSEATVRRLVANLMADLEAIPDHRDRRGRVYPLSSLLAIHLLASIGDGQGPEDAADFARDHAAWLRRLGILGARIPSAQTLRRLLRDRNTDLLAELQPAHAPHLWFVRYGRRPCWEPVWRGDKMRVRSADGRELSS